MNSFLLTLLNVFAVIIILGWFNTARKQFRSTQVGFLSTWRVIKMPILLILLLGIPYFIVHYEIVEPKKEKLEDRVAAYENLKDFQKISEEYLNLLQDSTELLSNSEYHYKMLNAFRLALLELPNKSTSADQKRNELSSFSKRVIDFYNTQDIGSPRREIFLSMHYVNAGNLKAAKSILDKIEEPEAAYYNYTLGRYYKRANEVDSSIFFFEWEIEFDGFKEGSIKELSALYYKTGRYIPLKELVYSEDRKLIHFYFKRLVFYIETDFLNYFGSILQYEFSKVNPIGTSAALLIALIWLIYVRKLDVFEPERWRYVLLTFLLGAIFIELVYPLTDTLNLYGNFSLNGSPLNDFLYCFIGIGMVEEFVKAIPLVIIVFVSKQADEPYDFILYAAASALGFAFVENISYIEASELKNINARMLTASVAHMSFSSAVAYGFLLSKFVYKRARILIILAFFLLASLAHGFYDFWLINEWAVQYSGFTVVFFIGTVHLWFVMKNNAINISNYFKSDIKLNNDALKNYLIASLVFVLMFSFIGIAYTQGKEAANTFLFSQIMSYLYFILYLTYSFSRFDVVRGYLAPFTIPIDFMIPRLKQTPNYSGLKLALGLFEINPLSRNPNHLLIRGHLSQRKTIDGNKHWYLLVSDFPVSWEAKLYRYFLVKHHDRNIELNSGRRSLVQVMVAEDEALINETFLKKEDLKWISWAVAKSVID